ncbi:MAG: hypothetical protein VKN13_05330 [Cyanobacteriota bacterium]|nr:hypothetical protein [Cyanobacteriota bacterium]
MNPRTIFVGLTSIRGREWALRRTLQSLLRQKKLKDGSKINVYLFLSDHSYLLDAGFRGVPFVIADQIARSKLCSVKLSIRFTENIGPYRKLLPLAKIAREEGADPDPILITADDDTLYPRDWVQRLVNAQDRYRCVVAFRGRQIKLHNGSVGLYRSWAKKGQALLKPSLLTVPTGKDGVCYRMSQLHQDLFDDRHARLIAGHADDLWFKVHTLLTGTPSILLHSDLLQQFPELTKRGRVVDRRTSQDEIESLFLTINKIGGNDQTIARLDQWLQRRYSMSLYALLRGSAF